MIDRQSNTVDFSKHLPDLWALCYPRIYNVSGRYASTKSVANRLMTAFIRAGSKEAQALETIEGAWAALLTHHGVPTYFLAPDLALALSKTAPPDVFRWAQENLPYESAVFMLPKDLIVNPSDREEWIEAISYARVTKDKSIPINYSHKGRKLTHYIAEDSGFILIAVTSKNQTLSFCFPERDVPVIDVAALEIIISRDEYRVHALESGYNNSKLSLADNEMLIRCLHLLCGTLTMMLRKPEMITTARREKVVQKKENSRPKEFWSPNIIGKNYRLRREVVKLGGSHASPRGHWVRGFWRDQVCGHDRKGRKEMWIEPYWRGGENV